MARRTAVAAGGPRRRRDVLLAVLAMLVISVAPAAAQQDDDPRISFDAVAAPTGRAALPPAVTELTAGNDRARFVVIDPPDLSGRVGSDTVELELFDDLVVTLEGTGPVRAGVEGSTMWSAETSDGGIANVTFVDGRTIASLYLGGDRYEILPVEGTTHLIARDDRTFPDEVHPEHDAGHDTGHDTEPPPPGAAAPSPQGRADPVIRVLTWFDDTAVAYWGSEGNAVAQLTATINEANLAYADSGIAQQIESAGIEHRHPSTGSTDANTALLRLMSDGDGYIDDIHDRRDEVAADLVALVSNLADACGIANLPAYAPSPPTDDRAFSVTDPGCARGNLSFVHELGHNMGGGHGNGDGDGRSSYSNGYRDLVGDFRTVMAYNDAANCPGGSCQRIPRFSSSDPARTYNGRATGNATHDNARTFGETAAAVAAYRGAPPTPPSTFVGMTPTRVLDSRSGPGYTSPWGPGWTRALAVRGGSTGVPDDATAVVLNVTGVGPSDATHLTVYPTGGTRPTASNVNLPAGSVRPNAVIVSVGDGGTVDIFNNAGWVEVVADVVGYFRVDPGGGGYTSMSPTRLLDSRKDQGLSGPWSAGETKSMRVRGGSTGVPDSADTVVLNVTVTQASAASHLTVWPTGVARPTASSLNYGPGETVANLVHVKVGDGGEVSFFNNSGSVEVIADVVGYYRSGVGGELTGITPVRVLDTRIGFPYSQGIDYLVDLDTLPQVPDGASAVVLNLTGVYPTSQTHLTLWPAGESRPTASNLNLPPGDTRANLVVAKVAPDGSISVRNNTGAVDVLMDVVGTIS